MSNAATCKKSEVRPYLSVKDSTPVLLFVSKDQPVWGEKRMKYDV